MNPIWIAPIVSGIVSIASIFTTNWIATRRSERERRLKKADELRELYVKYIGGTHDWLNYYASGGEGEVPTKDLPRLALQIELLDDDAVAHSFLKAIRASVPEPGTGDFAELRQHAESEPEWTWLPYDRAVNALKEHLKARKLKGTF